MRSLPRLIGLLAWICAALLWSSVGVADEKDALDPAKPPAFDSPSKESVLLRYKLKTDQVEKVAMDMDMDMGIHVGGQDLSMKMTMRIEAKARVTAVDDDGNISAVVKITRMALKLTGPKEVEFDSDKPDDNPDFKAVSAMINVGIPVKISPVGKMLETDLEPLKLAARKAGDAALAKSLEDSTNKMVEGTFVQLSEKPVKAGDTYTAGTVVDDKTKMHMSYKIGSVSGDKTQVVLMPDAKMELVPDAFPGADVKIKEQQVEGWVLFDAANGHESKGAVRMKLILDLSAMGQAGTVEMKATTRMTATVE